MTNKCLSGNLGSAREAASEGWTPGSMKEHWGRLRPGLAHRLQMDPASNLAKNAANCLAAQALENAE